MSPLHGRSQPYLNIVLAGALIGAIVAYPEWGWPGIALGALLGILAALTIVLVLVAMTWIVLKIFGRGSARGDSATWKPEDE